VQGLIDQRFRRREGHRESPLLHYGRHEEESRLGAVHKREQRKAIKRKYKGKGGGVFVGLGEDPEKGAGGGKALGTRRLELRRLQETSLSGLLKVDPSKGLST